MSEHAPRPDDTSDPESVSAPGVGDASSPGSGPPGTSARDRQAPAAETILCDLCGGRMIERHCRIVCTVCGYQRDCSDP